MSRNVCVTLAAAIGLATVALTGCSHDAARRLDSTDTSALPATATTLAAPPTAPLPPPETFTDLLNRLADPAVAGNDKLSLVEGANPDAAAALDRFISASRDGGYLPMTFRTDNVAWSATEPSKVTATVVVTTANPEHRQFTFPMEFRSFQGSWQLSKKTAQMLLAMQNSGTLPPTSPPASPSAPPAPTPQPSGDTGSPVSPSPTP